MSVVLVVNSGSSSFKYQLIDMDAETVLASGLVERIGEDVGRSKHTVFAAPMLSARAGDGPRDLLDATYTRELPIPDHTAGFAVMLDAFAENGPSLEDRAPIAVGHRVVHGGARFFEPTLITPLVEINIDELSVLAPLHNPANLPASSPPSEAFPDVPHVAVFDTAFHQTLPPAAYTYAIDARAGRASHRIRRYGFHGTSHKFVSEAAAAFLGRPLGELKQIVFHLGNGASVTAIDGGRSVETSMGLTPARGPRDGHALGRHRSGRAVPPRRAAPACRSTSSTTCSTSAAACWASPASRTCATSSAGVERGDAAATLAFDVYIHRLRAYAGAYLAQLGGVDVISFTAGVGENAPRVRAARARDARVRRCGDRPGAQRGAAGAASGSSRRTPRA